MRTLIATAAITLAIATTAHAAPPPPVAAPVAAREPATTTAGQMLAENNRLRAAARMAPQELDARLTAAAQAYAEHLAANGGFGHYADGRSPGARIAAQGYAAAGWAENMAGGQRDVSEAFAAWWNSGGHRANMLGRSTQCGFGHAGRYWVAVYATPAAKP